MFINIQITKHENRMYPVQLGLFVTLQQVSASVMCLQGVKRIIKRKKGKLLHNIRIRIIVPTSILDLTWWNLTWSYVI